MTQRPLIFDHSWRPPMGNGGGSMVRDWPPYYERPCEYMNCRRPRSDHRWSVSRKHKPAKAVTA